MEKIFEVKNKDWLKTVHRIITNQIQCTAWGIQDSKVVLVSTARVVDEQLCYDMGYQVYEAFNNGGVIVTNPGDFEILYTGPFNNNWLEQFCKHFTEWLCSRGLNAEWVKNDILVDGYKVCGTCTTRYGNIDYIGIHVGINTNLDDIKKICTKPMEKTPKGLGEYGVKSEEVRDMFIAFAEKYYEAEQSNK